MTKFGASFRQLSSAVKGMLRTRYSINLLEAPETDDELDALVGLMSLLDFGSGAGDFFGTSSTGYLLVPAPAGQPGWRELWRAAAAAHEDG